MKINLLPQELQPSKALRNAVLAVLAVLVLVIAPAVYYGYDLNMQVTALEEEHSTWQTEYAAHSEIARLVQERDALAKEVE